MLYLEYTRVVEVAHDLELLDKASFLVGVEEISYSSFTHHLDCKFFVGIFLYTQLNGGEGACANHVPYIVRAAISGEDVRLSIEKENERHLGFICA